MDVCKKFQGGVESDTGIRERNTKSFCSVLLLYTFRADNSYINDVTSL